MKRLIPGILISMLFGILIPGSSALYVYDPSDPEWCPFDAPPGEEIIGMPDYPSSALLIDEMSLSDEQKQLAESLKGKDISMGEFIERVYQEIWAGLFNEERLGYSQTKMDWSDPDALYRFPGSGSGIYGSVSPIQTINRDQLLLQHAKGNSGASFAHKTIESLTSGDVPTFDTGFHDIISGYENNNVYKSNIAPGEVPLFTSDLLRNFRSQGSMSHF